MVSEWRKRKVGSQMQTYIFRIKCDSCGKSKDISFDFGCNSEGDSIEWSCQDAAAKHGFYAWGRYPKDACGLGLSGDVCCKCVDKAKRAKTEETERAEYARLVQLEKKYGKKKRLVRR
mgnify:CR=1 FL=1